MPKLSRNKENLLKRPPGFYLEHLSDILYRVTKLPRKHCMFLARGFIHTLIKHLVKNKKIEFRGVCQIHIRPAPTRTKVILNGKTFNRAKHTIYTTYSRSLTYPMIGKPSPWSITSRGR